MSVLSLEAELVYNDRDYAGSSDWYDNPYWFSVCWVVDLRLRFSKTEYEDTPWYGQGIATFDQMLVATELEFTLIHTPEVNAYQHFLNKLLASATERDFQNVTGKGFEVIVLDQDIQTPGAQGWRSFYKVATIEDSQVLTEVQSFDVVLRQAKYPDFQKYNRLPVWYQTPAT